MPMFYVKCSVCNCIIENMDEGICIKTYYLINNKPVCIDCAKKMKGRCPICGDVKGWCSHSETERCFKNEIGCPCEKYKYYKDENAELKEKVSYLEDNLRVARKDRENLQLDVAKGLKEFVKDYPATSLRYLANEKYVEQLTKSKELIGELMSSLSVVGECGEEECELLNRADQFLKDSVE